MRRLTILIALLAAGGCTATGPSCTSTASRELATVERLISDTRADMARGYRTQTVDQGGVNLCLGGQSANVGVGFCSGGARTERVAIDPAAEQRKLDNLEARRSALAAQAEADARACGAAG